MASTPDPVETNAAPVTTSDLEASLARYAPRQWVQLGLAELRRAVAAFEANDVGAGVAGCKRAAGMALNGALRVEPDPRWGRTYVDHVKGLSLDESVPLAVREACAQVLNARPPNATLLTLRGPRTHERIVEATRDVMAHALAVVLRHEET
jgi:hypothetical protein